MDNRRDFLKKAALLSGAAGLSGALPSSIQKAFAIDPDPGTTWLDAEHVVILMQENRSFDHYFGTLPGVRGFADPHPAPTRAGTVMTQTDGQARCRHTLADRAHRRSGLCSQRRTSASTSSRRSALSLGGCRVRATATPATPPSAPTTSTAPPIHHQNASA